MIIPAHSIQLALTSESTIVFNNEALITNLLASLTYTFAREHEFYKISMGYPKDVVFNALFSAFPKTKIKTTTIHKEAYKRIDYLLQYTQLDQSNVTILLSLGRNWVEYLFLSENMELGQIDELILKEILFKAINPFQQPPTEPNIVNVSFTYSNNGKVSFATRQIECVQWDTIKQNYHDNVIHAFNTLISYKNPEQVGKFIFWYGPPGGGKSFCIRGLIQKLKGSCTVYYITDPEKFFMETGYINAVISSGDDDDDGIDEYDNNDKTVPTQPIRLLIIEDGLDFLLTESRAKQPGAISRLLNLTDGILGQGLRIIFLVTSNEIVSEIDPAFLRSGRCLQSIEFSPFNKQQAVQWLTNNNAPQEIIQHIENTNKSKYTLADLYAILNKKEAIVTDSHNQIGLL